jgi:AraC-like DNA-binding protein
MWDLSSSSSNSGGRASSDRDADTDCTAKAAALGLQVIQPHLLLSEIVEDIWDWDLPDATAARRLTVRLPPSTFAFLLVQYRAPLCADWRFRDDSRGHSLRRNIAVKLQTGIVTIRPTGAIGTVIVRLKPEAADCVTKVPLSRFVDQKVELSEIFCKCAVSRMAEEIKHAADGTARAAIVESFLLQNFSPLRPRSLLAEAASSLRRDPSIPINELASRLDVSVRHLSRGFKAAFGTGPKQFARLVRVEKAVAARRDGVGWTEIAHACGFSDQAHLIRDFRAIIGAAPEEIFRTPAFEPYRPAGAPHVGIFFNLFVG